MDLGAGSEVGNHIDRMRVAMNWKYGSDMGVYQVGKTCLYRERYLGGNRVVVDCMNTIVKEVD